MNRVCLAALLVSLSMLSACTTINVDHVTLDNDVALVEGDAVVVLGRHQSAEFATEASLVDCIGRRLRARVRHARVISEQQFVDAFYPWFEARTAPLHPKKLRTVLDRPLVAQRIDALKIKYLVWVEGSTQRTSAAGSMTCSVGPGGGGCFGFGTWEDTSDYETTIWELDSFKEVGRVSTEAVGNSYMPAFVIPIPMVAQVEDNACAGMTKQLIEFFTNDDS